MRHKGARTITVTAAQAITNARLLGGPLKLCGWSLNDGTISSGSTVDQSAAAPGAGATVASIALSNGAYDVEWTLELSGTPGAGDVDNVQMLIGATLVATSVNPGAVGNYVQEEQQINVTFGPLTLAWKTIGAASVGSVYKVEANVIPINGSGATISDGGQSIAFPSILAGGAENRWFNDHGIQVDTELRVQTTLGTIQGVLWYYLDADLEGHDTRING